MSLRVENVGTVVDFLLFTKPYRYDKMFSIDAWRYKMEYSVNKFSDGFNLSVNGRVCFFCDSEITEVERDTYFLKEGKFTVGESGIAFEGKISARIFWGEDSFAISTDSECDGIRCAIGHAVSSVDNAVFDRQSDSVLVFTGDKRLGYSFDEKAYTVDIDGVAKMLVEENVIAGKYDIEYSPINKESTFKKAPAGWMTWYAVKFDACESAVLENLEFQEKNLKSFGADAFWVDWEWFHRDMKGFRGDGVDNFHPDPQKYPNGLKFISDKIKAAGFIPALWTGFTTDVNFNEYMKENPEVVLLERPTWCGTFFYDISHPKYLEEALPKLFGQVLDWGYEAVKFDTIPNCLTYHDDYHDRMYDPSLSTKEAFRRVVKRVREILGKDIYMLSCAAIQDRDILWTADLFDAARVGDDVFDWDTFAKQCIFKTIRFYPLHNTVLYADPDNLVLREEFNTMTQARSRAAFISLLGLPLTLGDDFKALDEARVDLIKRALPVMDIHPMSFCNIPIERDTLLVNLAVAGEREQYNVVSVMNLLKVPVVRSLDIKRDIHAEGESWHIFDFFNEKYLGACTSIELELEGCETRVLAVREVSDKPQIVSTSRHITQGAAEIESVAVDEKHMRVTSRLVANDEYRLWIYLPEGYSVSSASCDYELLDNGIVRLDFTPLSDGAYTLEIEF